MPVETPASTVEVKLPETGLVTLTVGKSEGKDKVFFGMKDRDVREKTLELMGNKYGAVSYTHLDVYKRQPRIILSPFEV